jgi:hypothetical protein
MRKGIAYGILAFISVAIAIVHYEGVLYSWYWKYWWLDIIMHFGGGFLIGGIAFIFLRDFYGWNRKSFLFIGLFSATAVVAVGIAWEIFEVLVGATHTPLQSYKEDTAIDLILDILGSLAASLAFNMLIRKKI